MQSSSVAGEKVRAFLGVLRLLFASEGVQGFKVLVSGVLGIVGLGFTYSLHCSSLFWLTSFMVRIL